MQICSVSKNLILSDFATLKTLHELPDESGESVNFNFFAKSKVFAEASNKLQCVKLYQVTSKSDDTHRMSMLRQINCPKMYCAACPKVVSDELAIGCLNGLVKVVKYETMDTVHKFSGGMCCWIEVQ